MKKLLIFCALMFPLTSQACDTRLGNPAAPALSYKQAEGLFSRAVLSLPRTKAETILDQRDIDCYLALNADYVPDSEAIRAGLQKLYKEAASANSTEAKRAVIATINRSVVRDAGTGFVMFPSADNGVTQLNLYSQLIGAHCVDEPTDDCARAADAAQSLWTIAGQVRMLADTLNQSDKAASLVYNQQLDQRWRSYKDDTIKLWPQEVLLNSLLYEPQERGLSGPPSYKLLALRPSLGLSYLSDQSHRIQPTINVDLVGVYWWRYGGDGNAFAQPGRGLSASLVWDGDDTAYGLTYHHNPKWSATLARGDENDVVVSISFQLAHWLVRR